MTVKDKVSCEAVQAVQIEPKDRLSRLRQAVQFWPKTHNLHNLTRSPRRTE